MKKEKESLNIKEVPIILSKEVEGKLPKVLIEYLLGLIKLDKEVRGNRHLFRLRNNQLSGKEVQDIFHIGDNKSCVVHKVFGFAPLNLSITAILENTGCYMALEDEDFRATA